MRDKLLQDRIKIWIDRLRVTSPTLHFFRRIVDDPASKIDTRKRNLRLTKANRLVETHQKRNMHPAKLATFGKRNANSINFEIGPSNLLYRREFLQMQFTGRVQRGVSTGNRLVHKHTEELDFMNRLVAPSSILFAPFKIIDNVFTSKGDRLCNINFLKIVQPTPEVVRVHLRRPVAPVSPAPIYPRYTPILPSMAGNTNGLIRHLFERFAFGQSFSLFAVTDVVLSVSGVCALPST